MDPWLSPFSEIGVAEISDIENDEDGGAGGAKRGRFS